MPIRITLDHPDGSVHVEQLANNKNRIFVEPHDQGLFIPHRKWTTSYSLDLIKQIMNVKGLTHLCDEIMRDENPTYVQHRLEYDILSYFDKGAFDNKRVLEIGCGCGASTMVLRRMFPNTKIVGVELVNKLLTVAKSRAKHYGCDNIYFYLSPNGSSLPDGIGVFDYAVMSAVYEHLLPNERRALLPKIWSYLKPNAVLFINQTPHRYFPFELHTTGLPLINFLPDRIAIYLAHKFSKRVQPDVT
jgi:2-polyprenyl-3-methyl-5-hydroxy-6-metoxy-1,4-benzoquinol methylase